MWKQIERKKALLARKKLLLAYRPVASLVAPAKAEYSPPDSEVGMQTTGTTDGFSSVAALGLDGLRDDSASGVRALFAKACYNLVPNQTITPFLLCGEEVHMTQS